MALIRVTEDKMSALMNAMLGFVLVAVFLPDLGTCWTREGPCYSMAECDAKICFNYCKSFGYRSSSCDRQDFLCPGPTQHFKCRCTDYDPLIRIPTLTK
uniref:Uncharacterized protein n=2 Tax=Magallana gigas TaxID=29159 RepID=A0A8W8LXV4_MAGGI